MNYHSKFTQLIFLVFALFIALPLAAQQEEPRGGDNTSPYFESAAVRDSFMNCKKPIWTDDWKDLPSDQPDGVD